MVEDKKVEAEQQKVQEEVKTDSISSVNEKPLSSNEMTPKEGRKDTNDNVITEEAKKDSEKDEAKPASDSQPSETEKPCENADKSRMKRNSFLCRVKKFFKVKIIKPKDKAEKTETQKNDESTDKTNSKRNSKADETSASAKEQTKEKSKSAQKQTKENSTTSESDEKVEVVKQEA